MNKKNILVPIAALVIVSGTLFVVPQTHAQSTAQPVAHQNFFQGLISFLAQKFGLDKNQLQSAANEYQNQHGGSLTPMPTMSADEMQNMDKQRLDQLVSQGKITSDQETAILAELSSVRTKYMTNTSQNASQNVRQTQMKAMMDELKAWATAQGIDPTYVMMGGPNGSGKGGQDPGGRGQKPPTAPMSTP